VARHNRLAVRKVAGLSGRLTLKSIRYLLLLGTLERFVEIRKVLTEFYKIAFCLQEKEFYLMESNRRVTIPKKKSVFQKYRFCRSKKSLGRDLGHTIRSEFPFIMVSFKVFQK
jgi:hypothetical protein